MYHARRPQVTPASRLRSKRLESICSGRRESTRNRSIPCLRKVSVLSPETSARFSLLEYNDRINEERTRTSEGSEKGRPMADITEADYIWKNGEMIPWAEATTHVLSHSLHYGSGVFEGIRCYQNPETKKSYVFRLRDHMERLHRSCKIALIDLPYTVDELCDATLELIRKNNLSSCYIRPIVYRGYGVMGVDPTGASVDVAIAAWPWESYLGADALEYGVSVGVSSWRQRSNNAIPPSMKSTASYMNSILAKLEAKEHGYAEAVMLNEAGLVCEGTGENLFIVRDGILSTPPLSDGLLEGITRDTILCLADDLEIPAIEESLTRSDLYVADEVFMTGSAAELTPIGSVDGRKVGKPGEITRLLQDRFFAVVHGSIEEYGEWLDEVTLA